MLALGYPIALLFIGFLGLAHAYQYENILNVASSNLTVSTKTGTFVGNLNDTFPAVRQFKYIPYAKVSMINTPEYLAPSFTHKEIIATNRPPTMDTSFTS